MSTPNIGWLYYKDYLHINGDPVRLFTAVKVLSPEKKKDCFKEHFDKKNSLILGKQFNEAISQQLATVAPNPRFNFKTIYPGLTMGTGYTHETGEMGEFILGFFFDHATGYPCIPGSTVKGCLRSIFPQTERDKVTNKPEKYDYIASVIRDIRDVNVKLISDNHLGKEFDKKDDKERKQFIDLLEKELFNGEKPAKNEEGSYKIEKKDGKEKFVYQTLCVYDRDIFYDGYIISSDHPAINHTGYHNAKPFIAEDYITPHLNRKEPKLSPFTNPIPLMFLKILPEVHIQFQFDLKEGILPKKVKEELFRQILLDFGIGAKTNVGYGQFDNSNKEISNINNIPEIILPENKFPVAAIGSLMKNEKFDGIASLIDEINYLVTFVVNGNECIVRKRQSDKVTVVDKERVIAFCSNDFISPVNHNITIRKINKV